MTRKSLGRVTNLVSSSLLTCACLMGASQTCFGQTPETRSSEPGWLPVVVATGSMREQIDATPIEQRPYRPLHFYGNTIRRVHYRGTPFPRVGEVLATPVRIVARRPRTDDLTTAMSQTRSASRQR